METRDEMLRTRLIIQAEVARDANRKEDRERALLRASETLNQLTKPKFNVKKLVKAFEIACVEKPDFVDPVSRSGNELWLHGTFDLETLARVYFAFEGPEMEDERGT